MKKLQDQLKTVSNVLTTISKQIEQIAKSFDFEKPAKKASAKKTKTSVTKAAKTKKPAKTKAAPKAKTTPKAKKTAKSKAAPKAKETSPARPMTVLDIVFDIIKRSKNGITIAKIQEKINLGDRQLSNALYKLSKKGKILSKIRGVYIKNKDDKEK